MLWEIGLPESEIRGRGRAVSECNVERIGQPAVHEHTTTAARATHVATVSPDLSLLVLDRVLSGLESALVQLGANRVWIDPDRPGLSVMAELPADGVH
jgi:hypothetical protein